MKLARVGEVGREIPALIDADNIAYSLVGVIGDVDGSHLSPEVLAMLQKIDIKKLSIIEHACILESLCLSICTICNMNSATLIEVLQEKVLVLSVMST